MVTLSRRELLAAPLAAASLQQGAAASPAGSKDKRFTICAFSKHFQWTDVKGAAETMHDLGYEGAGPYGPTGGPRSCRNECRTICQKRRRRSQRRD